MSVIVAVIVGVCVGDGVILAVGVIVEVCVGVGVGHSSWNCWHCVQEL